MERDRGRDTSRALTEVRTVLSRAETALDTVSRPTEPVYEKFESFPFRRYTGEYEHDQDAEEMQKALEEVVRLLRRWRRKGRR